jgi:CHAT domain-containing protein
MLGSFHTAGARHVIGTLWIVDDMATVSIVDRFYRHLWNQRRSPNDALRAAQLEMIHSAASDKGTEIFSHPYAWAAFVCSEK